MRLVVLLIGLLRAQCTNPRVRRDWTQLSAADRAAYTVKTINETALQRLYERPPGNLNGDPTQWNYEQFAQVHDASNVANHGKPAFFIWHREFVYQFERALQTINPSITVPYWDWRLDSQNPFAAAVFQTFGRNGEGVENCVKTGVAGNWTFSPGKTECVKRCFSNGVWYSPESVANLLSNSLNFNSVRNNIENSPHAVVHTSIGGSCGQMNTMRSPIDPIFWLHHSMVDKLFTTWVNLCPEFKTDYGILEANYRLSPFPRTVAQVLDNRANGYCYTYSASRGDTPTPTITCPSAAANSTATPTPQVNNVWFQMWVQTLVPGVNQLRLSPDKLGEDAPASISRPAKRSIQMESSMADSSRNSTSAPVSKPRPVHLGLENYKPLPQYCIHPKYKIIAPRWDDKEDLVNIRYATPVNATLMKMMGFNMKIYMDTIIFDQMVVDYYNNKDGFTSPAALKYQIRNSTN